DFAVELVALVLGTQEVGAGVEEQPTLTGVGATTDTFGVLAALFVTDGHAQRTGTPEVPQLTRQVHQGLFRDVQFANTDRRVDVGQGLGRLVVRTEDVQRRTLVEGRSTIRIVTQVGVTPVVVVRHAAQGSD